MKNSPFERLKSKAKKAVTYAGIGLMTMPNNLKAEISTREFTDPEKNIINTDPLESASKALNIEKFYKTGTLEFVDAEAEKEALKVIENFLKNVDFDLSEIRIVGKYSKDRDFKGLSKEESDQKNIDLAQKRAEKGMELIKKVLSSMGYSEEDIKNINIKVEALGVAIAEQYSEEYLNSLSEEQRSKLIDENQGTKIYLESIKFFDHDINIKKFDVIMGDRSDSMKDKMKALEDEINKYSKEEKIPNVINLEGGNTEAHLSTLLNFLSELKDNEMNVKILIVTDEPDNAMSKASYAENIKKILALLKKHKATVLVKAFKPTQPKNGEQSYKIFSFAESPNVLCAYSPYDGRLLKADEWYSLLSSSSLNSN